MCSCTASGYFVWKAFEKIRVDGELGDKDGDDGLGDGVAFLLNLVGTLDPTRVELNWVWLLRLLLIWIWVPKFFTVWHPCVSSNFLKVEWADSVNSSFVSLNVWFVIEFCVHVEELFPKFFNSLNMTFKNTCSAHSVYFSDTCEVCNEWFCFFSVGKSSF